MNTGNVINSMYNNAIQQHLSNNFQMAHDLYVQILNIDENNKDINYLLGVLYMQNGFIEQGNRHILLSGKSVSKEGFFSNNIRHKYNNEINNEFSDNSELVQIFENKSIGAWRHQRMVNFARIFDSSADWLTIGDFSGRDSWMLSNMGIKNITASNLYIDALAESSKINNIDNYLAINAEKIDFPDSSIDFILCKEALHHMPRPYLAIYEMLRVARKGVFFIEPQDSFIDWRADKNIYAYRELIPDHLLGTKISYKNIENDDEIYQSSLDWWESDARNYVYTLSKREIRKIALGYGLPSFGIKCFNDFYDKDLDSSDARLGNPHFEKVKLQLSLHDQLCESIGKPYSYITAALFKETPSSVISEKLIREGFEFTITPSRFIPVDWPSNIPNLF